MSDLDQLVEDLERYYLVNDYRFVRAAIEAYVDNRCGGLVSDVKTVADEAFGPFPVQTGREALTEIERGIFRQRQELEVLRKDRDEWQRLCSEAVAVAEAKHSP